MYKNNFNKTCEVQWSNVFFSNCSIKQSMWKLLFSLFLASINMNKGLLLLEIIIIVTMPPPFTPHTHI